MKHLVTGGCSFTSHERVNIHRGESEFLKDEKQFWYYAHWLQTLKPELKVYNMGSPGSGNLLIARSVLYKLKQLLKQGIPGEEISAIVEWSNFHRKSYFIPKHKFALFPFEEHKNYANDYTNEKKYPSENGYWITMACPDMSKSSFEQLNPEAFKFSQQYLKVLYSDEERFIEWLEYFDNLINFCELHKIKLKCFFMHNPFSPQYHYGMSPKFYRTGEEMFKGLIEDKEITNTWHEDRDKIIDRFTWGKHLFNDIDWDKYCWFFEEENLHKNGGVLEWGIRNQIPSTLENFVPLYQEYHQYGTYENFIKNMYEGECSEWGHISSENYKKFTEEVILNWEMFK